MLTFLPISKACTNKFKTSNIYIYIYIDRLCVQVHYIPWKDLLTHLTYCQVEDAGKWRQAIVLEARFDILHLDPILKCLYTKDQIYSGILDFTVTAEGFNVR
jgi:hypothetical protein